MATDYSFETLKITSPSEFLFHVELNRPEKRNALNLAMWKELKSCFAKLATDSDCRCVVLSGAGKIFTAGIDLQCFSGDVMPSPDLDVARKAFALNRIVAEFQDSFTALEKCPKPVIAAVHGACIGAGVDLVCSADMRYCTEDAWFQVKEVDLGIVADVGTLQRLPRIVGNDSLVRELCYTGREFKAAEAKHIGLVSGTFADKEAMMSAVLSLGSRIASKSPAAVQGTKISLIYSRDHSVTESLDQVRLLNQGLLQGEDVIKSIEAMITKQQGKFSKL